MFSYTGRPGRLGQVQILLEAAFLRDNMIAEDPAKARAFFIWTGRENDFYLTDTHQRWLAAESFLIKVERPYGRLKLLASRFKFEWLDQFDPTGRYYLYSGRESGSASDGVFLRDIQSGTNRTANKLGCRNGGPARPSIKSLARSVTVSSERCPGAIGSEVRRGHPQNPTPLS